MQHFILYSIVTFNEIKHFLQAWATVCWVEVFKIMFETNPKSRSSTHPLGPRNHISQCHGDGQLSLVSHHGDQFHQPLKAVSQNRLRQRVELCSLLQDLGQHLHEGGSSLQVLVVTQTWGGRNEHWCSWENAVGNFYVESDIFQMLRGAMLRLTYRWSAWGRCLRLRWAGWTLPGQYSGGGRPGGGTSLSFVPPLLGPRPLPHCSHSAGSWTGWSTCTPPQTTANSLEKASPCRALPPVQGANFKSFDFTHFHNARCCLWHVSVI